MLLIKKTDPMLSKDLFLCICLFCTHPSNPLSCEPTFYCDNALYVNFRHIFFQLEGKLDLFQDAVGVCICIGGGLSGCLASCLLALRLLCYLYCDLFPSIIHLVCVRERNHAERTCSYLLHANGHRQLKMCKAGSSTPTYRNLGSENK